MLPDIYKKNKQKPLGSVLVNANEGTTIKSFNFKLFKGDNLNRKKGEQPCVLIIARLYIYKVKYGMLSQCQADEAK